MVRVPANDKPAYFMKILSLLIFIGSLIAATPVSAETTNDTVCQVPELDLQTENTPVSLGTGDEIFKRLHDSVECLRKKAATRGAEWLETESLLQRALEEAAEGHKETAAQLLMKAHLQAMRALEQADREAEAWKHRVIK